ncbi:hypothetical protein G7Z17_g11763 [Cylindrodendrum hubeiense]|uniref:Zn(2)-C6 fungal-type domain-containing protein n=1 Tax=Cylindrodendrum hubeiense TaxID=595255 RepID=A0A9P5H278_9HYPO|nr:hypothetical protein G7Z17_g11763 [Cylindrodendrum hubeiense]
MRGDGDKPCAQCVKKRIQCNRSLRVRFRHNSNSGGARPEFSDSQVWCKTSGKKLKFLDQSLEVARYYEDDDDEEDEPDAKPAAPRAGPSPDTAPDPTKDSAKALKTPIWGIDTLAVRNADDDGASRSAAGFPRPTGDTPRLAFGTPQRSDHLLAMTTPPSMRHDLSEPSHDDRQAYSFASRSTLSPYSILQYGASPRLEVSSAPLNERGKADLFRYYVKNIGPAFDSYDPNKYFTERIPSQATLSSPLLELILAVSAWHSNATKGDPQRAAKLDVNLEQLALTGMDDDSLDVALLLHHFILNMDGTASDSAVTQFTTSKLHVYPLGSRTLETSRDDVLWARLRQELFLAVMNQIPLGMDVSRARLDHLTQSRDDHARANRMLVELLATVQYCFGDDKNTAAYDRLLEASSTWMMRNPSSFTPVMIRRRQKGEVFPDIWLLNDCVAAGLQYFHLARILLVVHDPRVPRLCKAGQDASRWIDAQTKNDLEIICGIADSISDINPMHITACMAISVVGDRFTDPQQQNALLDILIKTTSMYGLSTELA